jgi:hypothetical protein
MVASRIFSFGETVCACAVFLPEPSTVPEAPEIIVVAAVASLMNSLREVFSELFIRFSVVG